MYEIDIKRILFIYGIFICLLAQFAFVPVAWSKIIRVDKVSPAWLGDGTTWNTAFKKIGTALGIAKTGDDVYVAQGIYYECVSIPSGVSLIGGFVVGKDPEIINANGAYTTIIDGLANGATVVMQDGSRIEGFKITNGYNVSGYGYGGGISISGGEVRIINNEISKNIANYGGGIYLGDGAAPIIVNNQIHDNRAYYSGGAIAESTSGGVIFFNTIYKNSADNSGGAIYCKRSNTTIANNSIMNNKAVSDGGGAILCENFANPQINNNIIAYNSAKNFGGGIYCKSVSAPSIINNTLYMNTLTDKMKNSHGIYCDDLSKATLENLIIVNNNIPVMGAVAFNSTLDDYKHLPINDPGFVDPNEDNFTLRSDSAALLNDQGAYGGTHGGIVGLFYNGITEPMIKYPFDIELDMDCAASTQLDAIYTNQGVNIVILADDVPVLLASLYGGSSYVDWKVMTEDEVVLDPSNILLASGDNTLVIEITDYLGKSVSGIVTINATDTTPPDVGELLPIEGECPLTVESPDAAIALDNCCDVITVSTKDSASFNKPGAFTIAWEFTDCNGNKTTVVQAVTVIDTTAPVVSAIPPYEGEAPFVVPAPSAELATDNNEACAITVTTVSSTSFNAPGAFTIAWEFTDCSGNSTTVIQDVTAKDVTAPVVSAIPPYEGEAPFIVPAPSAELATDNDEACAITVSTVVSTSFDTSGVFAIAWEFTDCSGNSTTVIQDVIAKDVTAPQVSAIPPYQDEIPFVVPKPSASLATDNNGACAITVSTGASTSFNTPGAFTIAWKFTDCSGNSTIVVQDVNAKDTTAPVVSAIPPYEAEIPFVVPTPSVSLATDNNVACAITVSTVVSTSFNTPGAFTIAWKFTDCSGNAKTVVQKVNAIYVDRTNPVVNAGVDQTVVSGTSVTLKAVATDNYTSVNNLSYAWFEGSTQIGTGPVLTKTFVVGVFTIDVFVVDEAGNSASDTVVVTVKQSTTPVLPTFPSTSWGIWSAGLPWSSAPRTMFPISGLSWAVTPLTTSGWGSTWNTPVTTSGWGSTWNTPVTTPAWGSTWNTPVTTPAWGSTWNAPMTTPIWGSTWNTPLNTGNLWGTQNTFGNFGFNQNSFWW